MRLTIDSIKLEAFRVLLSAAKSSMPDVDDAPLDTVRRDDVDESILHLRLSN